MRKLREEMPLSEYLPGHPTPDCTISDLRYAYLRRMAIMARKRLYNEMIEDLRSATQVNPTDFSTLTPVERKLLRDLFNFINDPLFFQRDVLLRIRSACTGPAGFAVRGELIRCLYWDTMNALRGADLARAFGAASSAMYLSRIRRFTVTFFAIEILGRESATRSCYDGFGFWELSINSDYAMQLSVIICTWNRAELLREALNSLGKTELPQGIDWEVLIVDNNSTDETSEVCKEFVGQNPSRYRYIIEKRQGKSFALNTGIENAKGKILSFTDDDVTVDSVWLAETIRMFESTPCAGVSGKIVPVWNSPKPAWLTTDGPYRLLPAIVKTSISVNIPAK